MPFGIPNLEQALSNFLESGSGITSQRVVEFDKKYLWVVEFTDPAPPAPFDKWFPASTMTVPFSILESKAIELPHVTLQYPSRSSQRNITATFYDDEQRTLLRWLSDWQNLDILNNGKFISGFGDEHTVVAADSFGNSTRKVQPLRQMRFGLVDAFRDEVLVKNFWVYPDGEFVYNGGQESEAQTYTITFNIVKDGVVGQNATQSMFSVKSLKSILGRFI